MLYYSHSLGASSVRISWRSADKQMLSKKIIKHFYLCVLLCTHVSSCSAQYIPITSERNTGRFLKVIMSTWKLWLLNVWGLFILCLSLLPLRKPLVFPHLLGKWIHSDVKKKKNCECFFARCSGNRKWRSGGNSPLSPLLPCLPYPDLNWVFLPCFSQIRNFLSSHHCVAGGEMVSTSCWQGGELSRSLLLMGYLWENCSASGVVEATRWK